MLSTTVRAAVCRQFGAPLTIEELVLAEAPVTDVAPLSGLGHLLELQLQGTRVEDVQPLAWLTQLQGLNLSRTPVRDVTPLATLGNLQWIDLSGTGVTGTSVAALRRRRPDLQVL